MPKILIVEDDKKLRKELEIFLGKNGYEIQSIENFENTISEIQNQQMDLILLDINLPNLDGEYILKELRKTKNVPIIMMTSRDSELDEILSMNYGADDYVTKPFNTQILIARISAILKRTNQNINVNKIEAGDFILDISKSKVQRDEKEVELTKNELKILHFLLKNRGNIVSREEIMNYLWDTDCFIDDNTLNVNVSRLKAQLQSIGLMDMIQTKRGLGYLLE